MLVPPKLPVEGARDREGVGDGTGGSEEQAGAPWALPVLRESAETPRVYHCMRSGCECVRMETAGWSVVPRGERGEPASGPA